MTDQQDRAPDRPRPTESAPVRPTDPDPEATPPDATDEGGLPGEPVGNDNIREGTVRGIMGGPHQSQGQGQGG